MGERNINGDTCINREWEWEKKTKIWRTSDKETTMGLEQRVIEKVGEWESYGRKKGPKKNMTEQHIILT